MRVCVCLSVSLWLSRSLPHLCLSLSHLSFPPLFPTSLSPSLRNCVGCIRSHCASDAWWPSAATLRLARRERMQRCRLRNPRPQSRGCDRHNQPCQANTNRTMQMATRMCSHTAKQQGRAENTHAHTAHNPQLKREVHTYHSMSANFSTAKQVRREPAMSLRFSTCVNCRSDIDHEKRKPSNPQPHTLPSI